MPGWLAGVLAIAQAVPQIINLIEEIVSAISGHPQGPAAGVDAVRKHLANMPAQS